VRSESGTGPEIRRIGIIGAGQMGRGIAHVCALAGLEVLLTDARPAALASAPDEINQTLARQAARGRMAEDEESGKRRPALRSRPITQNLPIATW
jgi:3-hydroxybutyryl-CoA dehydrogenase